MIYVAVIGPGDADRETEETAFEIGTDLARAGAVLVCGGLGGAMEAACRGARRAGGRTLGVLPGSSRDEANPFVDLAVATGMGEARNVIVVRTADALIAVGAGYGTLSEIAFGLKLGKPVIGLRTWAASGPRGPAGIVEASSAEEAVATALRLAGEPAGQPRPAT
ncbi:MAG: TIGR00725 family protein [Actinomycetota bacterium]